jgi:RelA/SpoT family (p)ppGpp synthetase
VDFKVTQILNPFDALQTKLLTYLPATQVEVIRTAFRVAETAHSGQKRSSGEPYIIHPIAVAEILADMHMDYQSISAAILHDVIEESSIDKAGIAAQFGEEIAALVDGVSKLDQINFENRAEAQAENLRKMMLAMTRDIRVILVKLADRLHNMRTLEALSPEKSRRIARETLEIYAPIANRLGMNKFKIEFEDIGFTFLHPVRHRILQDAVQKARGNRKAFVQEVEKNISEHLKKDGINIVSMKSREKHLYSLYKKMRQKELSLNEIMDIYALRIVVNTMDACYRALGVVHTLYKPMHGRFKDYIAVPKANGYQSLHTTVLGLHGLPIEIQIRTEDMDKFAENGIAAHWLYKWGGDKKNLAEVRANKWLKSIIELQEHTGSSMEFLENVKIDLYPDEVYVFTPTGEILSLPNGATAVDFAYAVHTDVGNACIAVKIDRRLVPLSTHLVSGQTIEVITAQGAHPNPAWLGFVATGKARSNIRHWLKTQQVAEAQQLGKKLLERALSALSISIELVPSKILHKVLHELKLKKIEDLWTEVGLGNQMASLLAKRLSQQQDVIDIDDNSLKHPLPIKGTEGMVVTYARCCRPIPGDGIVGFLSTGRGIVIHRDTCNNTIELQRFPERSVFVKWSNDITGEFSAELRIDVINKRGALALMANIIADCESNIENVHVDERDARHNTLVFVVQVRNRTHLAKIIRVMRDLPIVTKVNRVK